MHDVAKSLRNRRYYARKRHGITVVRLDADFRVVDFLVKARWLNATDAHDAAKIGEAIRALLETSAKI